MAVDPAVPAGHLRRLAGHGFWTVLAYVATAGSAFLVSVMLGRALGPDTFGRFSFALWLLRTVPGLLALGIPAALAKMAAERLGSDAPEAAKGFLRLSIRLHVGLMAAATAVGIAVMITNPQQVWFTLLILVGIAITLALFDLEALLTASSQFRVLSMFAAASGIAQVAVTALGIVLDIPWQGFLVLFVGVAAVGLTAMAWMAHVAVREHPPAHLTRDDRAAFLRFAGVATFALVVDQVVWGRPELFFLEIFASDADVGFYAAALRLASLAAVLPLVASKPLLPEFSRMRGAQTDEELAQLFPRICAPLLGLAAPIAAIGAAVSGPAIEFFYGPRFSPAATVTMLLIAGSVIRAATSPLAAALLTGHRPRFVAELGIVAVVANVVFDIVAISTWGLIGAAVANVAAQLIWLVGAATYAWRRLGLRYPVEVIAPVALLSVGAAGIAWLVSSALAGVNGLLIGTAAALAAYLATAGLFGMLPMDTIRSLWRRGRSESTSS